MPPRKKKGASSALPAAPEEGRQANGRFGAGNKVAAGHGGDHLGHRTARLRAALLAEVREEDIRAIVRKLIEEAVQNGDVQAAREILQRVLGQPEALDLLLRIEALEEATEDAREGPRVPVYDVRGTVLPKIPGIPAPPAFLKDGDDPLPNGNGNGHGADKGDEEEEEGDS